MPQQKSNPHQFKFESVSDRVVMSYRLWITDREWIEAGVLLHQEVVWLEPPCIKIPDFKKINLEKILDEVTNGHFKSAVENSQLIEWSNFYLTLEKKKEEVGGIRKV